MKFFLTHNLAFNPAQVETITLDKENKAALLRFGSQRELALGLDSEEPLEKQFTNLLKLLTQGAG